MKDITRNLWDNYNQSKSVNDRNELVLHYLHIVDGSARSMMKKMPSNVLFEDLKADAVFGLIDSIEKFDESLGFKFETFATNRIRGAILDELRKQDWLPRAVRTKGKSIDKTINDLTSSLNRIPTNEEIATELDLTVEQVVETRAALKTSITVDIRPSSYSPTNPSEREDHSLVSHSDDSSQPVELESVIRKMANLIKRLPEKERIIFTLYYYENLPLMEIGDLLGVTQSRACQILTKANVHCAAIMEDINQ